MLHLAWLLKRGSLMVVPSQDLNNDIAYLDQFEDPLFYLWRSSARPEFKDRQLIGLEPHSNNFVLSVPRRHVLIVGPPQVNKTSGIQSPAFINHVGPGLFMSTKTDILGLTAVARARLGGNLWHYCPEGEPPAPGMIQLRWSPISVAKTAALGRSIARSLVKASSVDGHDRNQFWRDLAAAHIGYILYAAHLGRLAGDPKANMAWVQRAVEGNPNAEDDVDNWLEASGRPDAKEAAERFRGHARLYPELIGSIRVSGTHALKVYDNEAVRAASENENFDPEAFVAGLPEHINPWAAWDEKSFLLAGGGITNTSDDLHWGRYDTLYITAASSSQDETAPVIVALLSLIKEAAFRQARADQEAHYTRRRPLLMILDELAGLAPDPDYPSLLREGASQGVLVMAALQDLAQADEKWGQAAADSFLTLHGELIILPGIRNQRTLEALSTLLGDRWEVQQSRSFSDTQGRDKSVTSGSSETYQRLPIAHPSQITAGHSEDPTMPLYIRPPGEGFAYADTIPVWGQRPMPRLLIGSMEFLARHAGPHHPKTMLPVPDLGRRDNEGAGEPYLLRQRDGAQLLARYEYRRRWFAQSRAHQIGAAQSATGCPECDPPDYDEADADADFDFGTTAAQKADDQKALYEVKQGYIVDEMKMHLDAMEGISPDKVTAELRRHSEAIEQIIRQFAQQPPTRDEGTS